MIQGKLIGKPVFFLIFLMLYVPSKGDPVPMKNQDIKLPEALHGWKRKGEVKTITEKTIFDYMDGSGELYLSYHFDHLTVYEYINDLQNELLVEIYQMEKSDEAFGLLSMDWSGDPVTFHQREKNAGDPGNSLFPRALYGKGYLRIWSGNFYVRILAVRDTPAAKETIMTLGSMITSGAKDSPPPKLVRSIPGEIRGGWHPNYRKLTYFRSHLVLNAVYYLSHENILNLGQGTGGIYTRYEKDGGTAARDRLILLKICYPGKTEAGMALKRFLAGYMKDVFREEDMDSIKQMDFFKIEDGWMGYRLHDGYLSLVFQCPDEASSGDILGAL